MTTPSFISVCETAAREAGKVLREKLGRITVKRKSNVNDLVTEADAAAQETIEKILLGTFPEHYFLGEEKSENNFIKKPSEDDYCWVVDPLDGTTNYVHTVPLFCTSIALVKGNEAVCAAVYNPLTDELFTAEKGSGTFLNGKQVRTSNWQTVAESLLAVSLPSKIQDDSPDLLAFNKFLTRCQSIRRTGSTALNLAFTASGRFDLTWAFQCHPWDMAAGVLLVQEAGGFVSKPDGSPVQLLADPAPVFAAANEQLFDEVIGII
ncbi:inositol monophosphatase [Planctomycetales bacterium]|nr:inositol monophosphatase [Planctomycetales bacterium]